MLCARATERGGEQSKVRCLDCFAYVSRIQVLATVHIGQRPWVLTDHSDRLAGSEETRRSARDAEKALLFQTFHEAISCILPVVPSFVRTSLAPEA